MRRVHTYPWWCVLPLSITASTLSASNTIPILLRSVGVGLVTFLVLSAIWYLWAITLPNVLHRRRVQFMNKALPDLLHECSTRDDIEGFPCLQTWNAYLSAHRKRFQLFSIEEDDNTFHVLSAVFADEVNAER